MPDMQLPTKKWGKLNKATLVELVHDVDVDINNLSYDNINTVRKENFCHRDKKNFCHNFHDFAATFDFEAEYSGARRRGGKTMRLSLFCIFGHLQIPPLLLSTIGVGNNDASKDSNYNTPNEDVDTPKDDYKEIMASKKKLSAVPKAVPRKEAPHRPPPTTKKAHHQAVLP
jgi:hypothetical protein